ncbi:efflux transporter outer membrane subunit [Desulfobacca acetoxidans]|uniref:RND efflux system, outer membrane lipoprotein, NodT family n=1 Tax=Desulfobacca acetoxidans (strain ATCC 700848 / DSM 11109 / ASRB2) TaxID=880072 RepID=F2NHH9_DESAR|nr:efflux transporter outer membrane subunit [Desulfobacca acetoxidans]AEB09095.1 RND efflux system, outer membrane lipoprotein, NodT family [Desulfobacca acetoxidans DSM 11109]
MMREILSFCALTALLLTGCTMAPPYSRPEAPIPQDWPSGPAYKDAFSKPDAALAVEVQWRKFFNDHRLQTVIAMALKNNRDLRVAALNVEKARALYRVQRAELFPTLETGISAKKERVKISGTQGMVNLEEYSINLGISSWEIDFFGRIRSLKKRALEEYLASEQGRRSAEILLISEVANAYLTLAADRENLKLARSTLETQQAAYNLIRRRFEVGFAPELDLRQVQTRVDTARVDVARYTELTAQDENALHLLAGSPIPADLLPRELSLVKPLPDVSPGTSSEVLLRRPDILQAEHVLKAANANIGAARAAFFPRISLTSAIGTASGDLSGLFETGSFVWSYAPRIVLPIFDARTRPALEATQVARKIALAQYERSIQIAFRETADALASRGTLGDRMAAQQSLVDATARTYQLSNARYEKGIDIYLNVLDAQRSLYAAQQGLIAIRLAKLVNQVRLYEVLGGGGDASTSPEGL